MRRLKLVIEYDGSRYHGWQRQTVTSPLAKDRVTIQSILEERLSRITTEKIKLVGAGRTDAGVHALGQVAAFTTKSSLSPEVLKRALNSLCPPDIRILDVEEVSPHFHPRFSAKAKSYLYFIIRTDRPPVFLNSYCWPIRAELDITAMKEAAGYLIGTHDFSAFRASGCSAKTTVRSITELSIEEGEFIPFMGIQIQERFVRFRICGNAFLRYMVRNIIGTLVEIGKGKRPVSSIREILKSGDRKLAGITAPAQGLFLERVYY